VLQNSGSNKYDLEEQAFFRDCLSPENVRLKRHPVMPPAIPREWRPNILPRDTAPAEILRRHPAFLYGFGAIPEMKIRQAVRGANRGRFGKFSSQKMRRNIRARSDLEFDCITWMEFDPDVEAFVEQPVILRYWTENGWHRHIPDLFVRRPGNIDGFVEVKFEKMASRPDHEAKYDAIGQAVAALGYSYEVLTERYIRRQPAFETLRALLLRSRRELLPNPEEISALQHILAGGPLSLNILVERAGNLSASQVQALILRGFLRIDLDQPLRGESLVQLTGRDPIRYDGPLA